MEFFNHEIHETHEKNFKMTIIEAGVIAGIPTGATIGVMLGKAHGTLGVFGGLATGLVSGGVAGWIYAFVVIGLLSVIGTLWRAAKKRADNVPTESDMALMTQVVTRGIFVGVLIAFVCWLKIGWWQALAASLAIAAIVSFIAVARCELKRI
jgi:hypothetical protein